MPAVKLPILSLQVHSQRYSCHGCGNCCRDFTVQLRGEDLAKIKAQGWEQKLGRPVTIDFRGATYLRQQADGACIFLMDDGLCRIHKEFGFREKPIACQLFPFHVTPTSGGLAMGINFACQSVLENKGAELRSHAAELGRMAGQVLSDTSVPGSPPMLTEKLRASQREVDSLINHIDRWLQRDDVSMIRRIDGLAWVVSSLANAKLQSVREKRFDDLLDVLFGALPDELDQYPTEAPTARQARMLRQAVFARTEDPKLHAIETQGRLRLTLSQLARSRRFKSGRGIAPRIGENWPPDVDLRAVELVSPASDQSEIAAIDDLMTRYLRASVLSGRYWSAGYYGWPVIAGVQALLLNVACIGWLARLHAAGRTKPHAPSDLSIIDVRAALGRIDRTAGRAKWLGSMTERLRLKYLGLEDGLRRLLNRYALVSSA